MRARETRDLDDPAQTARVLTDDGWLVKSEATLPDGTAVEFYIKPP